MEKICGIYKIENKVNRKVYIGKTSRSIDIRWKEHIENLRNDKNEPNPHLQNAWNKYGEESFEFSILEECKIEELKEKEEYWINKLESWKKNKGYNKILIFNGIEYHSEETKEKMSESLKGKLKGRISPMKGKHQRVESKEKIRDSLRGKRFGKNNPMFGKNISTEHKKILSESNKGENNYFFGKHYKGEENPRSKLSWEKVNEIRKKYKSGEYKQIQLAKEYDVCVSIINNIIHFKTWKEEEIVNE